METDYKCQAEYAKSNRSSCRLCKSTIALGSLRMGALVQSHIFDGKMTLWYHYSCFFKKPRVLQTSDIRNFEGLKFEDQEKIRCEISSERFQQSNFCIKAGSGEAEKCSSCSKRLKDPFFVDGKSGELGRCYHVKCFVRKYPVADVTKMSGFGKLKAQEKYDLLDAVSNLKPSSRRRSGEESKGGEIEENSAPSKRRKTSSGDALKEQSEELWRVRDQLDAEVSTNALAGLLEFNDQHVPRGRAALLDAVADGMVFGTLPRCPLNNALLTCADGGYRCCSVMDQWSPCLFSASGDEASKLNRGEFSVPEEYHDVPFLRAYKWKPRVRLFAESSSRVGSSVMTRFRRKTPLAGLQFLLDTGALAEGVTQREAAVKIRSLGGSLLSTVASGGIFVTQCRCEETESKLAKRARSGGMRPVSWSLIVGESLAKASSAAEVERMVSEDALADVWKSLESSMASKSEPRKAAGRRGGRDDETTAEGGSEGALQRLRVKGGAVVDPASGLEDCASVARDCHGRPLSAVLGMVDLVRGCNSYYKLQVLRSDGEPRRHWVFRGWGRIGTDIGGSKVERFVSIDAATQHFENLFMEKTGNAWGTERVDFKKGPGRFYPLDLDQLEPKVDESGERTELQHQVASKLENRVQALMHFLFDLTSMKNALLEFEIDVGKMPLGKISRTQIEEAYGVLNDLSKVVESKKPLTGAEMNVVMGSTSRFYTLIPHDFGLRTPPILDSLEAIKAKCRMLEDLLELKVAYSLMRGGECEVNPLDEQYAKLRSQIEALDRDSEEFRRIVEFVRVTHAPTHKTYSLEVVDVFSVVREGEAERFKRLENRMMLWHGSRRTNWAGILSQGLRIAPPEAPSTGYMFGKGVYFSDMASKSANYCYASTKASQGCLLLCEVALGRTEDCFAANGARLRKQFDSRKGVGATAPNPETYVKEAGSGVVYPIGEPVTSTEVKSDLLYNEYVVYKTDQIKQRYLVWVDFKFGF